MNLRQKISGILANFKKDNGRVVDWVAEERLTNRPPQSVLFPESQKLFSENRDLEWQHIQQEHSY